MNTLIRNIRVIVCLLVAFALPRYAWALRGFASFTIAPTSASVPTGVATNITAVETVQNGTGGSTRYIGPASFTTTVSPSTPNITVSFNPSTLTFPAATSTMLSTATVAVASSTLPGSYLVTIVINTNNPPNANVTPATNTFTVNVGTVFVPQKIWTPSGVNTNWSTAANWTQTGAPVSSNDVFFIDTGAAGAAGTVDNVVDSSQTIGSLTFGQTNGFHTTQIASGLSLTIGGTASGLNVGTGSDIGDGQLTTAAMTGGGSLSLTNPNSFVTIDQSHTTANDAIAQAQATLDLSGLGLLNATVSRILVGVDSAAALKGASGVLLLPRTNMITLTSGSAAPQVDIGDNTQSQGSPGKASSLVLGQTNTILCDSIAVGRGKTDTTPPSMSFTNLFPSPTAYFRGTNGASSRVGTWSIADGFGSKAAAASSTAANGLCDFSGGSVDALVNTMFIGVGASTANGSGANVQGFGTLTISAGTMDINTLEVGFAQTVAGTGTVNVNGGMLKINALFELGHAAGASGTLNISAGTVMAGSGIAAAGGTATISMTGGTLSATNHGTSIGTMVSPLTSISIANSTLTLAVQNTGPAIETGTLNGGGLVNTINLSSLPVVTNLPAQFPVIQYVTPAGNLNTFVVGTLPGSYQGFISNNTANTSIDVVITNGPVFPVMVWDGSQNGNWDLGTFNWKTNGVLTSFQQNYPEVRFDDSLTGTTNVILTTALTPQNLLVENSLSNYVFTGGGSLGGTLTFEKSGSGSVTLAESGGDNFSGGVLVDNGTLVLDQSSSSITGGATVNGGTLQIGLNDGNGSLPSGNVALAGQLAFNRANSLAVPNVISGAGTIAQIGTGATTLTGDNATFAGAVAISQGTLQLGNTNAIGTTASVSVTNGTFDVGGFALFGNGNSGLVVTATGAGVGGNGAIINSGASQAKVLHTVTLVGDATFGGTGDWDIRNSTGNSASADAALNGAFNLTKVGTNNISMRGVTVDPGLGNINVQSGSITVTATASAPQNSLGNSSATITVFTNATFTFDTIGTVPGKNVVLTNGGTLRSLNTNVFNSQLTLFGPANNGLTAGSGAQLSVTTPIIGSGGLTKNGSGQLILNTASTYSGSTVVSGGTLALYGGGLDGSIAASTNINVTTGAILDVSGRSDQRLTLSSGQTLGGGSGSNGVGLITGFLTVGAGATLVPGIAPTNTGVLVVSSNATLSGATIMKLNVGAGTNDLFAANGFTYGGTLLVTNFAGTITNGQTFQLFFASNGVYNAGSFGGGVTLPTAPGLTWTNNLTSNGSITAGVASATPAQPYITSVSLSGTALVINGTNGTAGLQFEVLSSTNVATPLSNWTSISTNTFSSGNFSVTNTITAGVPRSFFILRIP
jgi:autotransporter-associated beta strand protein